MSIVGRVVPGTRNPVSTNRPQDTLAGLQVARALAALAVTVHHALEMSNGVAGSFSPDWLTTGGAGGVDVFFVISGFIMAHTSFQRGKAVPSPLDFLQRRATRIYPLYWLVCLAMLSLMAMGFFQKRFLTGGDIAMALALLPGGRPIIGVAWTLVYEVYFYLVFAACLSLRSRRLALFGTGGLIVVFWGVGHAMPIGPLRAFLTDPIPLEFLFGLGLARFHAAIRWQGWAAPAILVCAGFALMHSAPLFVSHATTHGLQGLPRVLAWGGAGLAIVTGFLALRHVKGGLGQALLTMGNASYALYLTHTFVLMGYGLALRHEALAAIPQYLLVPPVVLLACLFGVASHFALERPLLEMAPRLPRFGTLGKAARRSESEVTT